MKATSIIRNSILGIGVAASLAAGSLGIGSAEARINGDPSSAHAQHCKNVQDLYDNAVHAYWAASTPEDLMAARQELNIWADEWRMAGCEADYGDIRFLVKGNPTVFDSVVTAQPITQGSQGPSKVAVPLHTN